MLFRSPLKLLSRTIWNKLVPSRVSAFVWKALQHRVPTTVNLQQRGIFFSTEGLCCSFCHDQPETEWHLFGVCPYASKVWGLVHQWIHFPLNQYSSLEESFVGFERSLVSSIRQKGHVIWFGTIWHLWQARNEKVFQKIETSPWTLLERIKISTCTWLQCKNGLPSRIRFGDCSTHPFDCLLL